MYGKENFKFSLLLFQHIQEEIFRPIRHTQTTLSLCYDERL